MQTHIAFLIGFSFLIVHELDAIRCHEWRMFPGLSKLGEVLGAKIFVLAHIPLLAILLFLLHSESLAQFTIIGISIFLIAHFLIHLACLGHKKNDFKDSVSWFIISCAGVCGLLELLMCL